MLILLCWLGAASRYANYLSQTEEKFSWLDLFARLLCSAFAGIITNYLCIEAGFSGPMTAAMVGLSGYAGVEAIQRLMNIVKSQNKL
ncbi:hypothetical protein BGC07_17755 [Piscirickettsia litoralis]|uniref:Holin n=2 Tax=Piscirickettsia litoralis TaxID=1891921 RepID=A0ABX3A146_9GAMM|nr:hypothetical protein BGC07_17755 [Piscirickettsia litoralis]